MTAAAARAFAPADPLAVSAAPDGSWIAIVERTAVTVVDPITAAVQAEVGIAAEATCEVAWAGNPSRLVVVQRHADHTIVHLVDVHGEPKPLGEVRIDEPVRVLATGALHALLVGPRDARVVSATGDRLHVGAFPSTTVPTAAGAFGPHHVIVAAAGGLEEWDTHAHQPRRRFRLPRPLDIRHVGGTEHLLWMIGAGDLARVEIFPLVDRGQPKVHELPEPVAAVSGHPRVDLLVWIGAATGQAHVLDLDGKRRGRAIGEPGQKACALVGGRQISAALAAPDTFLAIEVLDTRGVAARRPPAVVSVTDPAVEALGLPPPSTFRPDSGAAIELADTPLVAGGDDDTPTPEAEALAAAAARTARAAATSARIDRAASIAGAQVDRAAAAAERIASLGSGGPAPASTRELAERLAGWRATSADPPPSRSATTPAPSRSTKGWRELIVDWTRGSLAGTTAAAPTAAPLDAIAQRLGIPAALAPAIALLYGAHLLGHDGVAAADLAGVIDLWDEALGTGVLASSGVARWRRSRVRLAPVVRDALDDRAPRTGAITGTGTSPLVTPCAIRVASGRAADAATALAGRGGAYLVPTAGADPTDAVLEARARGAIALFESSDAPLSPGAARVLAPGVAAGDLPVVDA